MTYTLKITKQEYEFILSAVDAYHASLRQKVVDQVSASLMKAAPAVVEKPAEKKSKKTDGRKNRVWTPEQRAKQAELIRQRWAKAREAKAKVLEAA